MEMKWTITAGELLQILSVLVGGFTIYNRLSLEIADVKTKIEPLWKQFVNDRDNVRHWKETNGD